MLDPKIIAYLREHPDVLSHVIEKLLKDQDPSEHFGGKSKRGAFLNNQYDKRGRPVQQAPAPDAPDFMHDVLVADVRGVIENLVIDTVRDDESAFIDLFLLSMVCKSLRADLLVKVKELETRFDCVPHYCRAAFVYYEDLDTFKLFIDRLNSCAPAVATAWKFLLSNEDREAKFARLRQRMQRKQPDHFAAALLNDARDPITATICLHFLTHDKSPFTEEEVDVLFGVAPDTDLFLSMQPLLRQALPWPWKYFRNGENGVYTFPIKDHARYWYYCAMRYELGRKYQDKELMDVLLHIYMGADHVETKSLEKVRQTDERSPLLEAAFNVFHRFGPHFISGLIIRVASRQTDLRTHIQWAMAQMVSCWFDVARPTAIHYDAAAGNFVSDFVGHYYLDDAVRLGVMERVMRPTADFQLVKKVLDNEPESHLWSYYMQATVQQNVAVLEYIKSHPRIDPLTWINRAFNIVMSRAGDDGGAAQLRLFEAILPSRISDFDVVASFRKMMSKRFIIAGPLAARIEEIFARLSEEVDGYLRRGILAFKLQRTKSVSDALALLGLDLTLTEAERQRRSITALHLVLVNNVSRELSRAAIAYIAHDEHFMSDDMLYRQLHQIFLFDREELNPNALWECFRAPPRFADAFNRAMANFLPQTAGRCGSPLIFIEKWIYSLPEGAPIVATGCHAFNKGTNDQPPFVTHNVAARFMRLPATKDELRKEADAMPAYATIRRQLDLIEEEEEDSDSDS